MKSTLGTLLQLGVSLGVVLALMAVCARLLRRSSLGTGASRSRKRAQLEVVARQQLGKTASVAVVNVAGTHLLVGVSDGSVRLLTELDAGAFAPAEAVESPAAGQPPAGRRLLSPSRMLGSGRTEPRSTATFTSLLELLRDRTVRRT